MYLLQGEQGWGWDGAVPTPWAVLLLSASQLRMGYDLVRACL
jgi:hypothetical protein